MWSVLADLRDTEMHLVFEKMFVAFFWCFRALLNKTDMILGVDVAEWLEQ